MVGRSDSKTGGRLVDGTVVRFVGRSATRDGRLSVGRAGGQMGGRALGRSVPLTDGGMAVGQIVGRMVRHSVGWAGGRPRQILKASYLKITEWQI